MLSRCYAMVCGGVIIVITLLRYGLRRCYFFFITLWHYYHTGQDISLFVIICCYAIAGAAIIFFAISYYVVTLLPAVLLFSSLYYRHCFNFLSCYGFKFRAWIIFLVIRSDDFKKNNREHSSIRRGNKITEIGKERAVKGEDCKIVKVNRQRRGKKEKEKREDLM